MMAPSEPTRSADTAWLGRYEIVKRLARGGMAEIFLARAHGPGGIEKMVVLKRMLPALRRDAEAVTAFLDEARIAAALQHPNVVQTWEVGEIEGAPVIVMEYLHGESLRTILHAARERREPVPIEHAVQIAMGVLLGLHHAHERADLDGRPLRIVHRDVSPHHVVVTWDGAVE